MTDQTHPQYVPGAGIGAPEDFFDVDFSGVGDDDQFEKLPSGWYRLRVETVATRDKEGRPLRSKAGEAKVTWRFRVVDGTKSNRVLFVHTTVEGAGVFGLRRVLKAFHSEVPKNLRFAPAQYVGLECWADVGVQSNNPEYNEIKKWRPIGDPPQQVPGQVPLPAVPQAAGQAAGGVPEPTLPPTLRGRI